jgi:hypothetical protein
VYRIKSAAGPNRNNFGSRFTVQFKEIKILKESKRKVGAIRRERCPKRPNFGNGFTVYRKK